MKGKQVASEVTYCPTTKIRKVYTWWGTYGKMLPSLADHTCTDGGYSKSSFSWDIGLHIDNIP